MDSNINLADSDQPKQVMKDMRGCLLKETAVKTSACHSTGRYQRAVKKSSSLNKSVVLLACFRFNS